MIRYATVRNATSIGHVRAYLPGNYQVVWEYEEDGRPVFVIEGTDSHGWTLDNYVIPRYASGLIWCDEIDLSHPVMKEIPVVTTYRIVRYFREDRPAEVIQTGLTLQQARRHCGREESQGEFWFDGYRAERPELERREGVLV
jgi:hypothetical protein